MSVFCLKRASRLLILLMLGLMTISCGNNKTPAVEKPEGLIKKSDLIELLTKAYIIEAVVYYKSQKGIDVGLYTTAYYNALFRKYGVTRNQFKSSLKYYIETEQNATGIFLEVVNRLMSMQSSLPASIPENDQPVKH